MSIIDDVKSVATVIHKLDNLEAYRKILDLQAEVMELYQENLRLKEEVATLGQKLNVQMALLVGTASYWLKEEEKLDGPFCTCCWDTRKLLVRLREQTNHFASVACGAFDCPNCGNSFDAKPPAQG